jgi:hypothetical protein
MWKGRKRKKESSNRTMQSIVSPNAAHIRISGAPLTHTQILTFFSLAPLREENGGRYALKFNPFMNHVKTWYTAFRSRGCGLQSPAFRLQSHSKTRLTKLPRHGPYCLNQSFVRGSPSGSRRNTFTQIQVSGRTSWRRVVQGWG